jgi:hypothetical protein
MKGPMSKVFFGILMINLGSVHCIPIVGCARKKNACIKRLEFVCTYRELDSVHKEIKIGV